jgi:hypothetical protein
MQGAADTASQVGISASRSHSRLVMKVMKSIWSQGQHYSASSWITRLKLVMG